MTEQSKNVIVVRYPNAASGLMTFPLTHSRPPTVHSTLLVIAWANSDLIPERDDNNKVLPEQEIPALTVIRRALYSEYSESQSL